MRPDQLVDDPHLKASGGLVPMETEDGGTTEVVLLPLLMGGRRPGVRHAAAEASASTPKKSSPARAELTFRPDIRLTSNTGQETTHDRPIFIAAASLALVGAALLARAPAAQAADKRRCA